MVNRNAGKSGKAQPGIARDDASIESIWREAMLLRQFTRDEVSTARTRRAEAEAARRDAEQDAVKATHELCEDMRQRARTELQAAQDALAEAERLRADAEAAAARQKSDAEAELERARAIRSDAEAFAERIEAAAREKAEAILAEAVAESAGIAQDAKREAADEVRALMSDVEMARAAAQEELETQRILTETARIRAFSPGLTAHEMADKNDPQEMAAADQIEIEETVVLDATEAVEEAGAPARPASRRNGRHARKSSRVAA